MEHLFVHPPFSRGNAVMDVQPFWPLEPFWGTHGEELTLRPFGAPFPSSPP